MVDPQRVRVGDWVSIHYRPTAHDRGYRQGTVSSFQRGYLEIDGRSSFSVDAPEFQNVEWVPKDASEPQALIEALPVMTGYGIKIQGTASFGAPTERDARLMGERFADAVHSNDVDSGSVDLANGLRVGTSSVRFSIATEAQLRHAKASLSAVHLRAPYATRVHWRFRTVLGAEITETQFWKLLAKRPSAKDYPRSMGARDPRVISLAEWKRYRGEG